jgi:hypothetical protein
VAKAGNSLTVIPAQAGISGREGAGFNPNQIPAFAGMTVLAQFSAPI